MGLKMMFLLKDIRVKLSPSGQRTVSLGSSFTITCTADSDEHADVEITMFKDKVNIVLLDMNKAK